MDSYHSFWQLGDELRGQSKVLEDHAWLMAASKLAEHTRPKAERRINIDLSKGPAEVRHRENFGFREDNKFESFNFNMLNLDNKFSENVSKSSLTNGIHNMDAVFQNPITSSLRTISGSKYDNINNHKDPYSSNNNKDDGVSINNSADKRFKTLPSAEILPRNKVLGGYIFVCNNDTMQEDLKRQLFGLPPRYRDSVRAITPGLPLFLYNYTTHQLHGIFEATTFGGSNIDPTAWEDKKCKGESRFPAQVRIRIRKLCKPLDEDAFRPVLHHYDGPKFRLELSVPETLDLLDLCEQGDA
ncbi:B2 protein [Henckelia pumila]|uniref:B2 protein n=1 Tax=Henckelia pumila TaxID=405737 RepID=UPI003C6E221A